MLEIVNRGSGDLVRDKEDDLGPAILWWKINLVRGLDRDSCETNGHVDWRLLCWFVAKFRMSFSNSNRCRRLSISTSSEPLENSSHTQNALFSIDLHLKWALPCWHIGLLAWQLINMAVLTGGLIGQFCCQNDSMRFAQLLLVVWYKKSRLPLQWSKPKDNSLHGHCVRTNIW